MILAVEYSTSLKSLLNTFWFFDSCLLLIYCITPIFRVEEICAIFANYDFARNFPPAKIISTPNGISQNFPPAKFSSTRTFPPANLSSTRTGLNPLICNTTITVSILQMAESFEATLRLWIRACLLPRVLV